VTVWSPAWLEKMPRAAAMTGRVVRSAREEPGVAELEADVRRACASSTTRAQAKSRRPEPGSKIRRERGGSTATSTRIGCRPG
jgi:hypothetical protein